MAVFKIVCVAIAAICAMICFCAKLFISEKKYPNENQRLKILVRIRVYCFLAMLILMFICVIF